MFDAVFADFWSDDPNFWTLWWFKPDCSECQARGKFCKLKNNDTEDATQCYDPPPKPISKILYAAIGEGTHGAVFKGKVSKEISVAVKILSSTEGDGTDFINKVGTTAKIHHVNVARMLGFCADGFHRALVYDFFPNGSLRNYITPPDKESFLGWQRLQHIALGIAKGIGYVHSGCNSRILRFDNNPSNVLLDDNFISKIIDFDLAKLCSKNQNTVSITAAKGTLGYMAPEVLSRNFGNTPRKQQVVARSATEVEYGSVADAVADVIWVMTLLKEMKITIVDTPTIWCDNSGAVALGKLNVDFLEDSRLFPDEDNHE
ncbi:rust resistance kinase Lr10-like [Neltuma alba]|uniref:rust resistance kinase Lr10-like n=1 Tax=Neltuma alba TaxID=207710 RepID=UPI0010A5467C|nr:rust resistance kinase Lr10-like [Prosopis alba]